jgi:cytochrome P450
LAHSYQEWAKTFRFFNISAIHKQETQIFLDLVKQSLVLRSKIGESRNDLVNLMIRAMSHDFMRKESVQNGDFDQFERNALLDYKADSPDELDSTIICSTAIIIILAGFDSTSAATAATAFELTINQEIQKKLHDEIDSVGAGTAESVDYNTIQEMEYLDMICHEALRKYPAAPMIACTCLEDYKLPGTNYTIKKGNNVFVNVPGIHSDEDYYPDAK